MASCLYFGQVMHEREQPVAYKFVYQTVSIKVDIDQIEQEAKDSPLLSLNRFNWVSLRFKDHGPRDGTSWRTWVDGFLAGYDVARPARVELLCYPRILGYSFNPLAVWYAYDADNQLVALIAEVSNTFGQWHHYVLKPEGRTGTIKAEADKMFHVSPFIDMQARYHFRLKCPADQVFTYIKETREGRPFFYASQSGRQQPLNTKTLLKLLGFAPWRALKVISLIHWWALKIWLKGGQFHPTPKHLESVNYSHSEMKLC
ncbi:DUF1365 domain-containing protein [Thiomicrospira sp. R3]|uniref:DUF1365 domain-containing protein n=1 Tax=Thiomicrospira sp. R3 TaxID=3035472 RepID=UPI00259B99C3|nr:DUF1365 domain-containing protein [Thiomicrospira sp. R3]WFE67784.1 DUF1365 domain-containing protein [Thiomicrospira sp. R3]